MTMIYDDIIKIVNDYTDEQRDFEKEKGFERLLKQGKLSASQDIQIKILESWHKKLRR